MDPPSFQPTDSDIDYIIKELDELFGLDNLNVNKEQLSKNLKDRTFFKYCYDSIFIGKMAKTYREIGYPQEWIRKRLNMESLNG